MNNHHKTTVNKYTSLVQTYGYSHRALNWGSKNSQYLRFKTLAEIGGLQGSRILDVGCGLCDFYEFLTSKNIDVEYSGVDITPAMVAQSKLRFSALHLEVRDIVRQPLNATYDYVFCSGVFTYFSNPEEVTRFLMALVRLAEKGVAFNSLSSWATQIEEGELYLNPAETLEACRTLADRIVLRHDYLPHDFTVYLLQ